MRFNRQFMVIIATFLSSVSLAFATSFETASPIGYWKTIDDVTGKPKSIVQVWKTTDEILMAKVVKIFPTKDVAKAKICTACDGDKHNQPIVGMVIMSGLKLNNNQWKNGQILDPENGKTYSCSARLVENGKKLSIHGYVGFPMFGRSQTWERVDLMSG
ncbi:MAG: hypothetical protein ACD_60C00125G0014 [uncultured bacterium]|nr:MAG: hypothetical protein ACD_60C00125G0014 [uncultured bacterium]